MKRIIIFTLIALCAMCVFCQNAKVDGIKYRVISSTEAVVDANNKVKGDVIIPEYVTIKKKRYKVTEIENFAFYECKKIANITLPNSIRSIGSSAFDRCTALTNINIPESVTRIKDFAFRNTSIKSITIPKNVKRIEGYTFCNCYSLTSITIPESVTSIEVRAFHASGLTSINIPNSVTSIEADAFSWCDSLTSITIPNSVRSIGASVFSGCRNLREVIVPDNCSVSTSEPALCIFLNCPNLVSIKGHNIEHPKWVVEYILACKSFIFEASKIYKWAVNVKENNYY